MPEPTVITDGLVKRFGDFVAVEHVSLEVARAGIRKQEAAAHA